jgi:hypothetical protein
VSRYVNQIEPQFSSLDQDGDLLWVVPFRVRYMLGVCGYRYAGKSVVFSYLVEKHGFKLYSLSTVLRRLARAEGIGSGDREALQDYGDQCRKKKGADYLARLTLREIRREQLSHRPDARQTNRIAVGGFKRPEELEAFRKIEQFSAIAVVIDNDGQRYDRANAVGLPAGELGRPDSYRVPHDLIATQIDKRDRYGRGSQDAGYGQAVEAVMDLIPKEDRIDNGFGMQTLFRQIDERIKQLDKLYRSSRG